MPFEPGSDHPEMLALNLGMLDADFTIVNSPDLVNAIRKLTLRHNTLSTPANRKPE